MYTIGSLADLISGKDTPNKPKVEVKEITAKIFKTKSTEKSIKFEKKLKTTKTDTTSKFERKRKHENAPEEKSKKNEAKMKKMKSDDNSEENLEEVSVNAKNAIKRMRDTKKTRFVDPEKDKRTIFVGNIPLSTTKKHLLSFFGKYGKINTLRFRSAARASLNVPKKISFITKQFHPNSTTLNCYILYENEDCSKKALEANGHVFKDNHLRVDLVTSKNHDQKKAIFVGNIPFSAKDEDLWNTFTDCGNIQSVRVVRDGLTGVGKGYAYVNFESIDSVELAMQMTDVKIGKREIRIKRASASAIENKKRNEKVNDLTS